jgi:glycosyltransferase involved in cell wall biosynthesis/2-polyprenyl-3-methyl-5-hydroxy-6-metoxy-1,4-benzoquinol methylase
MNIQVSVIIPTYNGAETISKTLACLQKQTFTKWQIIVVNDGSTDETQRIVEEWQSQEKRIKLINQSNTGPSGARNTGIDHADYDWLLFLDTDDWIYPQHLEKLTNKLISDPSLDVVYCGWAFVTADGQEVDKYPAELSGDLFAPFSEYCVSIIHSYLWPKSLVVKVGKFDQSLKSCEDWELWQRIARTGARFGTVPDILAAYRMSPGSLTRNGKQLLQDACIVLARGHSPNPLIHHPVYPDGLPTEELIHHQYDLLAVCAGYLIGGGKDARELLELVPKGKITLDPYIVANCLVTYALIASCSTTYTWQNIWPNIADNILKFLDTLERETGNIGLAEKSYKLAEYLTWQKVQNTSLQDRWQKIKIHLILWRSRQYYIDKYHFKQNMKKLLAVALLLFPAGRKFLYQRWQKDQVKHTPTVEADHPSNNPDVYFEELFTGEEDPWKYTNSYEQLKYDQTLAMLPDQPINSALELACAEGFFTSKLATKVKHLTSTDISDTAISRCQAKMADLTNVEFRCLDFVHEPIPGTFDLIVCSEVLYFVGDRPNLLAVVEKFTQALNSGGYLLMCHANVTVDDPLGTGFNWDHALGAKFIGETFSKSPDLKFLQELQTPLYRIQLFQKLAKPRVWQFSNKPLKQEFIQELVTDDINPEVVEDIVMRPITQLPILCYEDIQPANTTNYPHIITPEVLASHLAYLKEKGFQSTTFGKWGWHVVNQAAMSKPQVIIIFKNNSINFANYAWPLLQEYDFTCYLGLYTDEIGKLSTTNPHTGEQIALIPWKQIRQLQGQGLTFASRGFSRQANKQSISSLSESYKILQNELATPINTYIYPKNKSNIFWQYLVGISGYEYAIREKSRLCQMNDSLLAMPYLSINSHTNLPDKINGL